MKKIKNKKRRTVWLNPGDARKGEILRDRYLSNLRAAGASKDKLARATAFFANSYLTKME